MNEPPKKLLLCVAEVAALLGVHRTTLYSMQATGSLGPAPIKIGRRVLFNARELIAWANGPRTPSGQLLNRLQWQATQKR